MSPIKRCGIGVKRKLYNELNYYKAKEGRKHKISLTIKNIRNSIVMKNRANL